MVQDSFGSKFKFISSKIYGVKVQEFLNSKKNLKNDDFSCFSKIGEALGPRGWKQTQWFVFADLIVTNWGSLTQKL